MAGSVSYGDERKYRRFCTHCNRVIKNRKRTKKNIEKRICRDPRNEKLSVAELVYKYLENIRNLNEKSKQRINARARFQRIHVRRKDLLKPARRSLKSIREDL